jgi:DNA adenine methylase
MALALAHPSLVLNDANAQLMNLWREVKEHPYLLIQMARKLFIETNNNAAAYNRLRAEFNSNPDSTGLWRACLFLYLNRFGFNGLWRTNQKGELNVPFGRRNFLPSLAEEEILQASTRLKTARLMTGDFEPVLAMAVAGDVVYCDPPYCGTHDKYTKERFSMDDHVRLRAAAVRVAKRGALVIISNSDCPESLSLYAAAKVERVSSRRSLSSKHTTRGDMTELVAVYEI